MPNAAETLVLLSPGFPENEADTTCLPAHQVFVRALQKNFPELNIIVIAFQYPYISHTYTWNNITVISLNGIRKGKLQRLLLWLKAWRLLKNLRKKYTIKGLLSFWINECALVGKYFGRVYRIKHYAWITGQDAKKGNPYIKLMHPRETEIFAMSDFLAKQLFNNYQIKCPIVIPNGIDTELFSKAKKQRTIDILAAGSLIPLKQYDVFIDVIKLVYDELPQVNVMLCGKGPEEPKLMDLIRQAGLIKSILLTGEKKHTEVLELMQQCKIFLHTSNYEGFSTVCLEALYAGAHVISFFRPMDRDIEHWHIVQTKEEMATKTLQLLLNRLTPYTPVLAYSMDDIATRVLQLFTCRM
jgi:glycosyltransferase involved in cell wall biosynthesis